MSLSVGIVEGETDAAIQEALRDYDIAIHYNAESPLPNSEMHLGLNALEKLGDGEKTRSCFALKKRLWSFDEKEIASSAFIFPVPVVMFHSDEIGNATELKEFVEKLIADL